MLFTVTTIFDGGDGSLRQAIQLANATPGADTIEFDPASPPYSPRSLLNPCKRSLPRALAARTTGQPSNFADTP
jgi:hypothetical protein